jgi:hypothetical protein
MTAAGYDWSRCAENIHRGPEAPSTVVADRLSSPEPRESILECGFEDMGVGVDFGPGGPWWVQDLGAAVVPGCDRAGRCRRAGDLVGNDALLLVAAGALPGRQRTRWASTCPGQAPDRKRSVGVKPLRS